MREGFFGLDVAVRGLYAAQRNLDVINHNINNINTPGYSRQKAVQTAAKPMPLYDGTGMVGTGSEVVAIQRIRDEYLDYKYWSEQSAYGEWDAKKALLQDMEVTFNEPSESGFNKIMDDFFSSLQELAKDPGSEAVRALVKERGVALAKFFNSTSAHFEKLQEDVNNRIYLKVGEINSIANQIQQLNRQIYTTELGGNTANDLRDQRTLLVDKLSKIVDVQVNEVIVGKLPGGQDDKRFMVCIGGKALVNHFEVSRLVLSQRSQKLNEEDVDKLFEVAWEDGNELVLKGGELKGYLDVRDGNDGENGSPMYRGVPFYIRKMNEFVRTFAMAFNEGFIDIDNDGSISASEDGAGHVDGYRGDSVPGDQPSGIRFFTFTGNDGKPVSSAGFINGAVSTADIKERYKMITAGNFSVGAEVSNDINAISTSSAAGEEGNIEILNSLIKMRHDSNMFAEGKPEDFMKSLVASLGIDSQQASRFLDNQEAIVKQIENRRISDSGVSLDEEMANLVKFQQAYSAAAKMVSTMAEVYDILINKVGVR